MGKWNSKYGDAFVSFPSIIEDSKLNYIELKEEL